MKLKKLTLKDGGFFREFLNLKPHQLASYAFENIYPWKALFNIYCGVIEDNLCVFFKDSTGCFLYLPPLGLRITPTVIGEVFNVMGAFNKNKDISRIENIEGGDLDFYQGLGLKCRFKSFDYVLSRPDMVNLRGNKFKPKRACYNYFTKHYEFKYLPFSFRYRNACLKLYRLWAEARKDKFKDNIYQGLLGDNFLCLEKTLADFTKLNLKGRIVKVGHEVKAFTFGFQLNRDTFCIFYEITDLSIKGLAQFIFRQFCGELKNIKYINIMDDSGLENLKKVKLSYRPARLIPSYIASSPHWNSNAGLERRIIYEQKYR